MDLLSLGKDPVSVTQPVGVDARYDPQFEEVQAEIDKLSSPSGTEPTDWDKVVRLASEILATKAKDLLVAAYLAVGLIQIRGSEGLIIALRVYADLLETYWQDLYPPKERHHALTQKRENFLRPLYWQKPMPKPPRELGKLHFAYYAME